MATAVYDNPITAARELWCNGVMMCFIKGSAITVWEQTGLPLMMQGRGAFAPGRICGDATAVCTERRRPTTDPKSDATQQ